MPRPVARPRSSPARGSRVLLAVGLAARLAASVPAVADDLAAQARGIVAKQASAVVRVTATVRG